MRRITQRRQFRNDLGRQRHRSRNIEELIAAVGLLAEEYDPGARRFLGNFPQAFSHVALVNSARRLSKALG